MRRFKPTVVLAAVVLSAVALAATCLAALAQDRPEGPTDGEGRTVVFMDEPAPPYILGELGGTATGGITMEILEHLFGRLGLDFEVRLVPWPRALRSAEQGRSDGVPLLMKTPEREAFLAYSAPIVENRENLYFNPGHMPDFSWTSFAELKGHRIGLVNGYTYGEAFLDAIRVHGLDVVYALDAETNLRTLAAGRVDLALEDETMARALIAAHPEWLGRIKAADGQVSSYFWYLGVSRLSPLASRLDEINAAVAEMQANGTLARILGRR